MVTLLPPPSLLFVLLLSSWGAPVLTSAASASEDLNAEQPPLNLRVVKRPGVILHKTPGPLDVGPVGVDFPGSLPSRFISDAWGIDAPRSDGGIELMKNRTTRVCAALDADDGECGGEGAIDDVGDSLDVRFSAAILARAKEMFDDRGCRDELESFLLSGVSNPDAGPRRMHWVGIEILPNQSLALHSHPNVEFAYIVEGVMHEHRIVDRTIEKKRAYVPEEVEAETGGAGGETTHLKYRGPDLRGVDASEEGVFRHKAYRAGDMFINTIGDVHQSYTMGEGVKLFVMWGDGNADVPDGEYPRNSDFLNSQSAKAWD